ncbi:hypothetical protein D3C80_1544710 [compost metagenome]
MARGELFRWPHIQQRDITFMQSAQQLGAGNGFQTLALVEGVGDKAADLIMAELHKLADSGQQRLHRPIPQTVVNVLSFPA